MVKVLRSTTGEVTFLEEGATSNLAATLLNAYQFPTYTRLFDQSGLKKVSLRSAPIDALLKVKPSFKKDYASLQEDSFERAESHPFLTDWISGSTAKPLLRISSAGDEEAEAEAVRRAFRSIGITSADRVVCLDVGASDIYLFYCRVLSSLGIRGPCFVKVSRRYEVASRMTASLRPTVVLSVPSVLNRCISSMVVEKNKLKNWNPKKVVYIGEAMHAALNTRIRRELGARCFSFYGTTEIGSVGIECEQGGNIHIPLDLMCPTILSHGGNAVRKVGKRSYEGVLAWTSLRFREHPLVKYCVGDLVRLLGDR